LAIVIVSQGIAAISAAGPAVPVGDAVRAQVEADWIERDREYTAARQTVNMPPPAESPAVTTVQDAAGGCDGVKSGRWGFHTASGEQDPWWQVDLGRVYPLERIVVYNRTDGATAPRTRNLQVLVREATDTGDWRLVYQHTGETFYGAQENRPLVIRWSDASVRARFVRLAVPGRCSLALDEVEVYARDAPEKNVALGRPADQKSVHAAAYASKPGREKLPATPPRAPPKSAPPVVPEFLLIHTQDVVGRARQLAARLRPAADAARLVPCLADLDCLQQRLTTWAGRGACPVETRRELYLASRRLARRIAFCNPALQFDRLLFIKRPHPTGLFHMVHQFYGFGARPGGGLYVLADPCSDQPRLTDLLAGAVVDNGRGQRQPLVGGSCLAPEVSFDGRTILFAYSACQARGIEWSPRASFHIFRVQADGTGLTQLTDGGWNDFDPCFLPNGRIAFISERRGGYLRCGGSSPPYHSPTYTLHSMAADGSDVICLSYHETHEWQPSVDRDGQLVYTRWDYVDRDTNVAHHLWTCGPDGRDPRSFHGNYPTRRESRPWMEMDIRAVPGSAQYVATAAAHHGVAFGSLVLIDPRIQDDGAMAQVTRLTPEVPLPEAESGNRPIREHMVYGTPWPLSEDDYLCVRGSLDTTHGIWWLDRHGNRELLYRDPAVPCVSPLPLRPRPQPPILPAGTTQADGPEVLGAVESPATIAVLNVYDSDFAWPPGTNITALRIIQVLPKTTPRVDTPRIGVAHGTNARAVLGTVPVEADGSAYFEAPVGKALYFQALDDQGRAVQSMRSATYVHPGERLTCRGCHERKHVTAAARPSVPLALQRGPSPIRPAGEGASPFSYVRLVQPVLDRQCVDCHRQRGALDLTGAVAGEHGWTRSYQNLAAAYGFYFHSSKGCLGSAQHGGSRTTPGQFGARASKLLNYLDDRHYGVRLAPEEYQRLVLWLDCNSEFYGAYEHPAAQARGEVVLPTLD
jgi:hypothetical protein